ncbi:MAG: purine-nucleoside phosphorylase, partial [Planctomycetota bacterium]
MSVASADASVRLAEELGAALEGAGVACPPVGIVLGSGLGAFADALDDRLEIPFESLPSMARSTVPGHAGRFVVGRVDGAPVLCSQGRVHLYEGHSAEVVTRGVRALCRLGVRELVLT